MNKQIRLLMYGCISLIGLVIIIVPPLLLASYSTQNTKWDGTSTFLDQFDNDLSISISKIPLSLLGDLNELADIIVIIGGNLPYYPEESQQLSNFVTEGGKVLLFEDNGYGEILTESFGLSLGGTLIDQDFHGHNPYHPKSTQNELQIKNFIMNPRTVVFNHAVRVEQTFILPNTRYYPLFPLAYSLACFKMN